MSDTWQNEFGNIKVNDRGMRVAQRDGQEELLLEGQVRGCFRRQGGVLRSKLYFGKWLMVYDNIGKWVN